MKAYSLDPITKLTPEIIDDMVIHTRVTSLRRAASTTPCMKRIEGNESIPTLYYIKGVVDPEVNDWKIHALVMDINKYLLLDTVAQSDESDEPVGPQDPVNPDEPINDFIRSVIKWDEKTGKTADDIWVDPYLSGNNNEELRFRDSVIAYYEESIELGRVAGHRVGVMITPDPKMIEMYPDAKVYFEKEDKYLTVEEAFYEYEEAGYKVPVLYYYPLINVPGQENIVRIIWNDQFEESFPVIIEQSCTLESTAEVVVSESELSEAISKGGNVRLGNDITLIEPMTVDSSAQSVLDLNGHKVANEEPLYDTSKGNWSVVEVDGGKLVIEGDGEVSSPENDAYAACVKNGGELIIEGGVFNGNISTVYIHTGIARIKGGEFKIQQTDDGKIEPYALLLNCLDENYKNGTANIIVTGGKFHNFNPINCKAEGAGTNFVADDYTVMVDGVENLEPYAPEMGDVWYEVVKK